MAKAPEIGAFGAALPPDAEPKQVDEETAIYEVKAHLDAVAGFYEALYSKTAGITIQAELAAAPAHLAVSVGEKCEDAGFGMITATARPKEHKLVDLIIVKRGAADDEEYPESSPWEQPDTPPGHEEKQAAAEAAAAADAAN